MKNVELLCKIAMHIRTVGEVDTTTGPMNHAIKSDYPACLMCNATRAGIVTKKVADSLAYIGNLNYPNKSTEVFGVSIPEWQHLIFLYYHEPTGEGYYNAIVDLLEKYGELDTLRRMEAEAENKPVPANQSFSEIMAELNEVAA